MPYPEDKVTFYESYPQKLKAKQTSMKHGNDTRPVIGHKIVVTEDGRRIIVPRQTNLTETA